jgi:hypothetical protein
MNLIDRAEKIILSQTMVYYPKSKPGMAKSAMSREIARRNVLKYIHLNLSQMDESEIGGLPRAKIMEDGIEVMQYIIPKWAYDSNNSVNEGFKGCLIHFEELNRARKEVRDACLQVLNERGIGHEFRFAPHVYMCASGNLGDVDGCDVEELDSAVNNRLYHEVWELPIKEWVSGFAKDNVNPYIVSFLEANPDHAFKKDKNTDEAFATYRSWTQFSNFINFECNNKNLDSNNPLNLVNLVNEFGMGFVGNASNRFLRYLQEKIKININDVLNNFSAIKKDLKDATRDKYSELLRELKEIDLNTLSKDKLENVIGFLKICDDDERIGYFKHVTLQDNYMSLEDSKKSISFERIVAVFKKDFMVLNANLLSYTAETEVESDKSGESKK